MADKSKASKAASYLGGMSGKAVKSIEANAKKTRSRLNEIMGSMSHPNFDNQSTDSNNRK